MRAQIEVVNMEHSRVHKSQIHGTEQKSHNGVQKREYGRNPRHIKLMSR